MEQSTLKKRRADICKKIALENNYEPVLKLEHGAYTSEEWDCILEHSQINIFEIGSSIQSEHLAVGRLRESLINGLENVGLKDLRVNIWMLICKVQNNRKMYSSDIFAKMKQ